MVRMFLFDGRLEHQLKKISLLRAENKFSESASVKCSEKYCAYILIEEKNIQQIKRRVQRTRVDPLWHRTSQFCHLTQPLRDLTKYWGLILGEGLSTTARFDFRKQGQMQEDAVLKEVAGRPLSSR
jgi:hypothetical protein